MQPGRDKISGCSHLASYLSVARFVGAYEAQPAKVMKKLEIGENEEKQYYKRLKFGSCRRGRRA